MRVMGTPSDPSASASRPFDDAELTTLAPLAAEFPTRDHVLAEVARLSAERVLPKGTVHVVSDVHGEDAKLRHVINNASGTLRPLVVRLFGEKLDPVTLKEFLALVFYPRESLARVYPALEKDPARLRTYVHENLRRLFELVRALAPRYTLARATSVFPEEYRALFTELLQESTGARPPAYSEELVDALVRAGRALHVVHLTVRAVRNLAVDELVVAGDCYDRGPRADRVVEYLSHQPHVAFTWGNHDAAWLGACLGQETCIMHVLRVSARYRRFSQLEEGYGITLQPLEHLARTVYDDDPATAFGVKGTGLREEVTLRRMQKAAAVMQYKLEAQAIDRNPHWGEGHRRLLGGLDPAAGIVTVDGVVYPLLDKHVPTFDKSRPFALSAEETACLARIKQSFLASAKLWDHMNFLGSRGGTYLVRDGHLVFHGCVPVDANGSFQSFPVDGVPRAGKALFDAIDVVLARVLDHAGKNAQADLDLLWYLWCGPRSPLFGKDRITTFERDLIADEKTHVETKNPYFKLIHESAFCDAVLREFGIDPAVGLIVNGHVPVKLEKGEQPMKKSGKAITIDGAFSQAYGDHGFTLLLEPDATRLALHHHFESVEAAVERGVDIIPTVTVVRAWEKPRRVVDTERGREIERKIALLTRLGEAYETRRLRPAANERDAFGRAFAAGVAR
jgi:fructose-1,6-bisphosphatase-3